MRIAVACGGTGGHVIPGLVVARRLKERGHDVALWVGGRTVEDRSVSDWRGSIVRVTATGFQGFSWRSVAAAWFLTSAFRMCCGIMKRDPPDALLAMGGYASVGPVCAARSLGIPVVLHEANAIPGRAISFLARFSASVAISFEATRLYLKHPSVTLTGYPVRETLPAERFGAPLQAGVFTVLAMGGSQGAHRLNEVVPSALSIVKRRGAPVQAVHLTGQRDEAAVREVYAREGIPHVVQGFMAEMGRAYASADLAVTRAGAGTCAELAVCGVPALLVPLPTSRRGHQLTNARSLAATGGADAREQKDLTPEWLADHVAALQRNRRRLAAMRVALGKLDARGAAERIADLVERAGGNLKLETYLP
ncbi:MAG: UDP-N-acetylglucosamine--N-acetylmuramyl-(pentapeptide) pyrophosphoryl-undecaprenol N-acetylglucosamine transferase [Verrucomicrobiota bacterium]|nr:UDP-N-acetylglucosamine--N-acetylmuramyl-(pentapeptide) pyrophosphoryl-undecaprenol N-acetylglucosamine transferase [Verrucomicrobiota bacterium]